MGKLENNGSLLILSYFNMLLSILKNEKCLIQLIVLGFILVIHFSVNSIKKNINSHFVIYYFHIMRYSMSVHKWLRILLRFSSFGP